MGQSPVELKCRYVSTAEVSAALGVSVTTVKRWVDEGILPAHKTAGGHRKLLYADVVRLVRDGPLPKADLTRLDGFESQRSSATPAEHSARLTVAARAGDAEAVRSIIHGAYHAGHSIDVIADEVICPALSAIGHEWSTGAIDVMHEHRGSQMIAAAVYELKGVLDRNAERQRPVAVGGAIEADHYVLPSLLAQSALLDNGWEAVNIGPNTPFSSFTKAIREMRPKLVWVSVSNLHDADRFESEYREFYGVACDAGVPVAIGGRALTEELRSRIPYTAYGDRLAHLVAFARTLHVRPRPPKRGRPTKR